MKSLPSALATHVATRSTTLATALRITRSDATVLALTSHDIDDTISGVLYKSNPGLDVTSIVTAANLAVGNLELKALHDGSIFTTADILSGVWRNAAFTIFRYNYASISDGIDTLLAGTLGELGINLNIVTAELRSLIQYLQQPVGSASQRTCRYRLGSTTKYTGGLCRKTISGAPFTVSAAVTGVTSNQVFRDSARTEAADYFGEGEVIWLTGLNAGLTAKVSYYAADGTFQLARAMLHTVVIGDTFTAVVGCRKRWEEDCKNKFNNLANFGGEKDRQGFDALTKGVLVNV